MIKMLLNWIPAFAGKEKNWDFPEEARAYIRNPVGNKIIGIILLNLFSVITYAQTASIVFQSENKDSFQVAINQVKQHKDYTSNLRLNKLKGNLPYNVIVNFKNDTVVIKKNIYLIDDGLAHIYLVNKKTIQLKKVIPAASYPSSTNQLVLNYIENLVNPFDTITEDTAQIIDTNYVVPFESYYHLEDYNGKIGCPFPIKDIEQGKLRGIILAENLEESKLEKVKFAISDMDSACVLVHQIKELIVLFEFEETRLDFAKFMFRYTFDIDNYERLYDAFNFENSKDELKLFIMKN